MVTNGPFGNARVVQKDYKASEGEQQILLLMFRMDQTSKSAGSTLCYRKHKVLLDQVPAES